MSYDFSKAVIGKYAGRIKGRVAMNEVIAATSQGTQLNGQEYVNLCDFLRQNYESAMIRATNMSIHIKDSEIGSMIMHIERYIRQCDEQRSKREPIKKAATKRKK